MTAPVALLHGEILSYKTILNVPLLHCGIRTLLEQAAQPKGDHLYERILKNFNRPINI